MAKQISIKQKKIKVFEKIQSLNFKSEEEFAAMTPTRLVEAFPDITIEELRILN